MTSQIIGIIVILVGLLSVTHPRKVEYQEINHHR